jgi:hypothetical protein
LTSSIILVAIFVPESPKFLYSRSDFTKLKDCLTRIAKINGTYREDLIDKIIVRLSSIAEFENTII